MKSIVDLRLAYRLLNHGPTVLVTAAHGKRRNVMAAAWNMPLDFDPPKIAIVIDKKTYTRELIEASGTFALNLPCRTQADKVMQVGSSSGRAFFGHAGTDKFTAYGIDTFAATQIAAPLVTGCMAWLECRVLPEPHMQSAYDLFVAEVVAAQADTRAFSAGRWHFEEHDALRTLHYVAGGAFFATGDTVHA